MWAADRVRGSVEWFTRAAAVAVVALLVLGQAAAYVVCGPGPYWPPACGAAPEYPGGCCGYAPCLCARETMQGVAVSTLPPMLAALATLTVIFLTSREAGGEQSG